MLIGQATPLKERQNYTTENSSPFMWLGGKDNEPNDG